MAKNKHDKRKSAPPGAEAAAEADPKVQAAADVVRQAREQLHKAESAYENVKQAADKQVERLRETTVGDLIDDSLEMVKKHPGLSVIGATALGFFLGRLFRR